MCRVRAGVLAAAVALTASASCDAEGAADPVVLVLSPDRWTLERDHQAWPRPEGVAECDDLGFGPEQAYFEVGTDLCPWGTWTQETEVSLDVGDALIFDFHHLDLWAADPAEAVVEFGIGDTTVWSMRKPIPAEAAFESVEITVQEPPADDGRAWLHVHNHGDNSYRLGVVRVRPVQGP